VLHGSKHHASSCPVNCPVWLRSVFSEDANPDLAFLSSTNDSASLIPPSWHRAFESRVRRAYGRVERNHPGSEQLKPKPLSEEDKLLLQAVTYGAILIPS
jgi:hypothetical protein